ncbi:hypothetical protein PPERSA_01851 [Pseudocohnilembus persalinus]|uniref:Uncharacterized protein n=1 Tax=Pseudocohnilembus persalinus TaxID=266149 RepID=A0A0V0R259_PSEPJ|nr:hypothetical protein PPERSA_01851 [Pseudocohnilembus persalinus]|eukprot:KRX08598.1 hypothetical protein PPERSA_01851 [Pseudocohnilembus persalinus]
MDQILSLALNNFNLFEIDQSIFYGESSFVFTRYLNKIACVNEYNISLKKIILVKEKEHSQLQKKIFDLMLNYQKIFHDEQIFLQINIQNLAIVFEQSDTQELCQQISSYREILLNPENVSISNLELTIEFDKSIQEEQQQINNNNNLLFQELINYLLTDNMKFKKLTLQFQMKNQVDKRIKYYLRYNDKNSHLNLDLYHKYLQFDEISESMICLNLWLLNCLQTSQLTIQDFYIERIFNTQLMSESEINYAQEMNESIKAFKNYKNISIYPLCEETDKFNLQLQEDLQQQNYALTNYASQEQQEI